jgi:hypothetical protein
MTLGVGLKYIVILGTKKLSVSQTNNGQISEPSLAAVSYGVSRQAMDCNIVGLPFC